MDRVVPSRRGDGGSSDVALLQLGWTEELSSALRASGADGSPARVARVDLGMVTALAPLPLRATCPMKDIAIGDWVLLSPANDAADRPSVTARLPRRSELTRRRPGAEERSQVIAANLDQVMVMHSSADPVNFRRLERYLALVWSSKARPLLVLTKVDLPPAGRGQTVAAQLASYFPTVRVYPVSSRSGEGVEALAEELGPGTTAALIGPSGAGKSTLVNRLTGREAMSVGAVRSDGRGRHTTSHRELISLPGGGWLIDTPGMRTLGLWEAEEGLQELFSDLDELAAHCRFSDCAHRGEPGCAVSAAVREGTVPEERVASWLGLALEMEAQRRAARGRPRR